MVLVPQRGLRPLAGASRPLAGASRPLRALRARAARLARFVQRTKNLEPKNLPKCKQARSGDLDTRELGHGFSSRTPLYIYGSVSTTPFPKCTPWYGGQGEVTRIQNTQIQNASKIHTKYKNTKQMHSKCKINTRNIQTKIQHA